MLPVGGSVEEPARPYYATEALYECLVEDAPLVVALLVPGVGKKQIDALQTGLGQHVGEYLDGIVADHADVFAAVLVEFEQQVADARAVDLDADVVALGMALRHLGQAITVAEADLDEHRLVVAEQGREIKRRILEVDAPAWLQRRECAPLSGSQAAFAQHVAADLPVWAVGCAVAHAPACSVV